jgi:hypothetical protein
MIKGRKHALMDVTESVSSTYHIVALNIPPTGILPLVMHVNQIRQRVKNLLG